MKSKANRNTVGQCKAYRMTPDQISWIEGTVGAKLESVYPGYWWLVEVEGPLLRVICPIVNKVFGFTLKLTDLDVDLHRVVMAGGEILERGNMVRGKAKLDEIYNAKRDVLGDITPHLDSVSMYQNYVLILPVSYFPPVI